MNCARRRKKIYHLSFQLVIIVQQKNNRSLKRQSPSLSDKIVE